MDSWLAVVRIVGREKLVRFCEIHGGARKWLSNWVSETEAAAWDTPWSIRQHFATASFLAGNTVIFNVKGNAFRLEVVIAYRTGVVQIAWIGTHAEYDRRLAGR
jgi:mRNA interferase HigB